MKKQIEQLKEFHTAFNLPQRKHPQLISESEFDTRHRLLIEEMGELKDANHCGDIIEVADAITDCMYVIIGTALQFGLTNVLERCFDEVHRSNMTKLGNDGKPIVNETGKVVKGPNYSHPDIAKIINNAQTE
jgi:predicted HAD superfamily Cof-like phosphohydrolase